MIARARTGPKRSTLLYVEEHAESVALVAALLAGRKDLRLLHAADANLGIKLARSRRPEAILIDIDLAMGALEFVKVLRADPATETTPILALAEPLQAAPFMEALAFALEFTAVERSEQNPLILRFGHHRPIFKESR